MLLNLLKFINTLALIYSFFCQKLVGHIRLFSLDILLRIVIHYTICGRLNTKTRANEKTEPFIAFELTTNKRRQISFIFFSLLSSSEYLILLLIFATITSFIIIWFMKNSHLWYVQHLTFNHPTATQLIRLNIREKWFIIGF